MKYETQNFEIERYYVFMINDVSIQSSKLKSCMMTTSSNKSFLATVEYAHAILKTNE